MKNFNSIIILLNIILFISCSDSESPVIDLEEINIESIELPSTILTDSNLIDNVPHTSTPLDSKYTDPNYTGTICGFKRNSELELNTLIEYEYLTNLSNITIFWSVLSGDVEIISGQNSNILTIKLGENFKSAEIEAMGTSNVTSDGIQFDLLCSDRIVISK